MTILQMLPAVIFAVVMIYFLGFYDFGMDYVGDEFFAREDIDIDKSIEIKFLNTDR